MSTSHATTATTGATGPVDVDPAQLDRWIAEGSIALIDVREPFEFGPERIAGARNVPLSRFDPDEVRSIAGDRRPVFYCRTGRRTVDAARRFAVPGDPAHHLAGGIEAWKATGLPVERAAGAPRIDVMRQVQITAGSLVLLGVVLGLTVSPWLVGLSAFVGAGLVFAGLSGWCGMAMLLGAMPWNRTAATDTATCSKG